MKKNMLTGFVILISLLAINGMAHALSITPSSGTLGTNVWTGASTGITTQSESEILTFITPTYLTPAGASFLYKKELGAEDGSLSSSYETTVNSTGDWSGGTITYTGGSFVGGTAFLYLKGGNHSPWWYLFNF